MAEPEFVEWSGNKTYKCPKGCGADIRYAKFFGSDKKLLTTDGKPEFAGKDSEGRFKSNTGWPTNPETKKMHECGSSTPKTIPESELKRTDLLLPDVDTSDVIWNDTKERYRKLFVVANEIMKELYPNIDEKTDRAGQIRSKIIDQIQQDRKIQAILNLKGI